MRKLSGLDASFLYLETENAPMHIGGLSIIDGQTADGPMTFDRLRQLFAARIASSHTFTDKLIDMPLRVGRPYWTADPDFDLGYHLERTTLPEPGGWRELEALMAWEQAQPLDRERPLWKILYVEGLDSIDGIPKGAKGLISRVHHAAIDGVSGTDLMQVLFDPSPRPRPLPPVAKTDESPPSTIDRLRRAGSDLLPSPAAIGDAVGGAVKGLAKSGAALGLRRVQAPPFPFTAPRSRLNQPVGKRRVWSCAKLSLERIKAVRAAARQAGSEGAGIESTTINDVVLTVCSGALRNYLSSADELPERPLIAMVPVSVRAEEQRGTMGNQVSAMLVSLATDREQPLDRLRRIGRGAGESKVLSGALGARTLMDMSDAIPFGVAGVAARLYTRMELARRHRPIFNLVITNVPGPQMPLYVAGAPLLMHAGAAPIFDGMGLILPVFSYHGALTIGALSCPELMPDIDRFTAFIEPALSELEGALGISSATDDGR